VGRIAIRPYSNWPQTIPGKSWFIAVRMYGPLVIQKEK